MDLLFFAVRRSRSLIIGIISFSLYILVLLIGGFFIFISFPGSSSASYLLTDDYCLQQEDGFFDGYYTPIITERKYFLFRGRRVMLHEFMNGIKEIRVLDFQKGSHIIIAIEYSEHGSGPDELEISLSEKVWNMPNSYSFVSKYVNGTTYDYETKRYYNYQGDIVQMPSYHLEPFVDGRSIAQKEGKYGVINRTNQILIPLEYDLLERITGGIFNQHLLARREGKSGIITYGNKVSFPFMYDEHKMFFHDSLNLTWARLDKKWGVVNTMNEVIIPFEYDTLIFLEGGHKSTPYFIAKNGKHWFIVSIDGRIKI